jgi:hypothetical protein
VYLSTVCESVALDEVEEDEDYEVSDGTKGNDRSVLERV